MDIIVTRITIIVIPIVTLMMMTITDDERLVINHKQKSKVPIFFPTGPLSTSGLTQTPLLMTNPFSL